LWLGYFETNVVHLAVGKRIQITLPFRPDSFTAFTNNGNVRWGLFDYFDAGTRITGDGPLVGGSAGLGAGVRGYMLSLDFGTNFVDNTPMGLFARSFLPSANLMGSQSDYTEIGEGGPIGGEYSNTVAFAATTNYTLALTADRIDVNRVLLTATVTGGGLNLSHSVLDTNFAYHRFDSFGIRPANAQTTADQFTFSDFKVEVLDSAAAPTAPSLNIQKSGTNVVLSWANSQFRLQETTNLVVPNWQSLGGAGLSFTNPIVSTQNTFFRLIWP
jgi:hypothetical protein